MPRMDGYELARAIRGIESAQGRGRTPIVACTANALPEEAARCADAGMDDCLVKPVQLSQLANKMERHLPRCDDRAGTPPDSTGLAGGAVPVDLALIASNWGGSEGVVRDILATFRAANDKDSARLRQAVAGQDMPQVTHCAHRMLGAGSMVGARDFALACERIDHASRAGDWDDVNEGMQAFEREYSRLNAYFESL
jgi:HPt (histidine-containing phosphotransfer) domain-containing protein